MDTNTNTSTPVGREDANAIANASATASLTAALMPLRAGTWTLDPYHSSVGFTIRHLGISKVRGRFLEFDVELVIGAAPADCSVTASVALASIDTGNADRDAHVLAPDMLDVERRPTLTFRSTGVELSGEEATLVGDLTIGEVTRPVTLQVEFGGLEPSAVDGKSHAGFEATGEIRRSDFGLRFGPGDAMLGDVVKIQLDVQFVEPA